MNKNEIKKIYRNMLFDKKYTVSENDSQLYYINLFIPCEDSIFILDAGCGNGQYARQLACQGYKNIYAIDLFDKVLLDKGQYLQASIDGLPFSNNVFNYIYSNSVIFYLDDPEEAILEFSRVLKNDGLLLFTAHTRFSLFTLWRVFKRDILKMSSMAHLDDIQFYSANYYRKLLKKNGFELVLQDGYRFSILIYPLYHIFATLLNRKTFINIPIKKAYISHNKWIGRIKSEISYHSVFVARKID